MTNVAEQVAAATIPGPDPSTRKPNHLLAAWIPDAGTRKRVLVDNPARLYGF